MTKVYPISRRAYYWYSRYEQGCEYPIYCRKKGSLKANEEILLNVNELAEGKPYCQVSGLAVSHNQRYLAYGLDVVGRRIYEVFFKDLETGETSSLTIPNTTGNITWAADDQHLFYSKQDPETLRAHKIFRHELYSNSENDQLIFEEKDEEFSCHVLKTKSEAFLLIHSESTISSEIRFVDASQPLGDWKVLQTRIPHLEYAADHYEDHFWIRTNHQAQNFKVVKAPVDNPRLENWEDFIPHREDVLIEDFDLFFRLFCLTGAKQRTYPIIDQTLGWKSRACFGLWRRSLHRLDWTQPRI